MTQIMARKLISPRHKGSIRHASGLVQTGLSVKSPSRTEVTEKAGGLNRSVQHHLIWIHFLKVVFMAQGKRNRLSTELRIDMWRRWKAGESLHEIGRAFGKNHGSIRFLLSQRGGIAPAARRRSPRTLTVAEREDISRGIASGSSIREIARGLQRAVSTVSREVARHGGRPLYRASG